MEDNEAKRMGDSEAENRLISMIIYFFQALIIAGIITGVYSVSHYFDNVFIVFLCLCGALILQILYFLAIVWIRKMFELKKLNFPSGYVIRGLLYVLFIVIVVGLIVLGISILILHQVPTWLTVPTAPTLLALSNSTPAIITVLTIIDVYFTAVAFLILNYLLD